MTDAVSEASRPLALGRISLYGLIAIVTSIVANLIVRAIGTAIIDVSPEFMPLSDPMPTIFFTATLVLIASIVFASVDRVSARPRRVFNVIALVALLLSFVPDIGMLISPAEVPFGGITFGAVAILLVQHVVAGAIAVYTLSVFAYRQ